MFFRSYAVFFFLFTVSTICVSDTTVDIDDIETSTREHSDSEDNSNEDDLETERRYNRRCRITEADVEEAFKQCEQTLKERQALEVKLSKEGRVVKPTDRKPDSSLNRNKNADPIAHSKENAQLPFDEASLYLCKKYNLTKNEIARDLPNLPLNGQLGRANRERCLQMTNNTECNANSVYRTADGRCNNLRNPTWGNAMACQQRLLNANYFENSQLRLSRDGRQLPAPRTLSLNLHYHFNRPTNYVTHMYMFFGQLLDHDLTLTPFSTTIDNEAIECCPPQSETHPQCLPVLISNDDPFYSQFGVTCLNFVRSVICPTCVMGLRQQMDQVTSFIDASFVYGNSDDETRSLRTNDGTGTLRTQSSRYGDLLPSSPNPDEDQCSFPQTNDICFQAGDPRANQHTVLASLHTIFVREHNRIATRLRQINPGWDGERLFQETRRIVAAEVQVITYKEYLPITLGNDRMTYFSLWMGDSTRYDPTKNPSMMIEFTTAAFRFGHSLINSVIANNPLNSTNGRRLLRNEFFQPFDLRRGFIGPLVSGASNSPAQWFDRHLVEDVTNFLYRVRGNQTGLDLAAFNINRGRDHGIPTYVDMVRYCSEGQKNIRNFDDLVIQNLMLYEQANALRRNYRYVQDVDLWPGILMEIPNDGAVVGPTAACVIGLQFNHLKYGDRFFVEHSNQAGSFTYPQLRQLRTATLSQIMCMNDRNIDQLPRNAMIFNSRNNPNIDCSYVRGVDLSYWRE